MFLLYGWKLGQSLQGMDTYPCPRNGVAKRQDRFSHWWGEPKQPENLGHVCSGDPELASQRNSGFHLITIDPLLPLLGKGHGFTIEFGERWELDRLFRQFEGGGKRSVR